MLLAPDGTISTIRKTLCRFPLPIKPLILLYYCELMPCSALQLLLLLLQIVAGLDVLVFCWKTDVSLHTRRVKLYVRAPAHTGQRENNGQVGPGSPVIHIYVCIWSPEKDSSQSYLSLMFTA